MSRITSRELADAPGIIVGHSNLDLDCLGSLALARYLHPGYLAVRSRRIHPLALQMYRLFQDHLDLAELEGLDCSGVPHAVVVDTRTFRQIQEYFPTPQSMPVRTSIYDHHPDEGADIPHQDCIHRDLGANTSIMAVLMQEKGLVPCWEDATLALAGIVADTGSFSHPNVKPADFGAAMWLLEKGADMGLVRRMTHSLYDQELDTLLHDLAAHAERETFNGHLVTIASIGVKHQIPGFSLVAEKLMDFEQTDALFCIFNLEKEKSHVIIARSTRPEIDVAWMLSLFGGGGHPQAAAAQLKKSEGIPVIQLLRQALKTRLSPSLNASQLMDSPGHLLAEDWTMLQASLRLEEDNLTALPVLGPSGSLAGILSLKDIQKARKSASMHAPLKAYMSRNVVFLAPGAGLREMELLFFQNDFSLIPVCRDGQVLGIITRRKFLHHLQEKQTLGT